MEGEAMSEERQKRKEAAIQTLRIAIGAETNGMTEQDFNDVIIELAVYINALLVRPINAGRK